MTAIHLVFSNPKDDVRIFVSIRSSNEDRVKVEEQIVISELSKWGYTAEGRSSP